MGKKLIVILTIAALGIFTLAAVGCAAVTDQRAAVSGIVVADGLAQEGTQVKQGDILVKVKSIAGGSSEMVINGKIVNKPSDGRERLVSIGLGLFIK